MRHIQEKIEQYVSLYDTVNFLFDEINVMAVNLSYCCKT